MKGAEFHRNNISGNHVVEGGECYLVRGVSSCYLLKYAPYKIRAEENWWMPGESYSTKKCKTCE